MDERSTVITDINIPFGRMVAICFKWMLASFVAIIPIYLVLIVIVMIFGGMFAGCTALMNQ